MSVIIKGMDVPDSCSKCKFTHLATFKNESIEHMNNYSYLEYIYDKGFLCLAGGGRIDDGNGILFTSKRNPKCPLIDVDDNVLEWLQHHQEGWE